MSNTTTNSLPTEGKAIGSVDSKTTLTSTDSLFICDSDNNVNTIKKFTTPFTYDSNTISLSNKTISNIGGTLGINTINLYSDTEYSPLNRSNLVTKDSTNLTNYYTKDDIDTKYGKPIQEYNLGGYTYDVISGTTTVRYYVLGIPISDTQTKVCFKFIDNNSTKTNIAYNTNCQIRIINNRFLTFSFMLRNITSASLNTNCVHIIGQFTKPTIWTINDPNSNPLKANAYDFSCNDVCQAIPRHPSEGTLGAINASSSFNYGGSSNKRFNNCLLVHTYNNSNISALSDSGADSFYVSGTITLPESWEE